MTTPDLGPFLRARRQACSPEDFPFPSAGRRRVPGLRRSEVAVLAGLSVDYYTRLEQGREHNPSQQVIDGICLALQLNLDEQLFLYRLAGLSLDPPLPHSDTALAPELLLLMDGWQESIAFIVDPVLDLVALNDIAQSVFAPFSSRRNMAEMIFLDPVARNFFPDWTSAAETAVTVLRLISSAATSVHRLDEVLETLTQQSVEFSRMWADFTLSRTFCDAESLVHTPVGSFDFNFQMFSVASQPGHQLIVSRAALESTGEN